MLRRDERRADRQAGANGPRRSPARGALAPGRSTTLGQERALLRLFGVIGLDRAGRPLAGAAGRPLAGQRARRPRRRDRAAVRDGPARVRPRTATAGPRRRVGCDRPRARGRAAARARSAGRRRSRGDAGSHRSRSTGSTPTGSPAASSSGCSASHVARGSGRRLRSRTSTGRWMRRSRLPSAGFDLLRVEVPIGRELADRHARSAGQSTCRNGTRRDRRGRMAAADAEDGDPAPTGSPASAGAPPAADRWRRGRAARLRAARHGDPAARRAGGGRRRGVRARGPRGGRSRLRDRRAAGSIRIGRWPTMPSPDGSTGGPKRSSPSAPDRSSWRPRSHRACPPIPRRGPAAPSPSSSSAWRSLARTAIAAERIDPRRPSGLARGRGWCRRSGARRGRPPPSTLPGVRAAVRRVGRDRRTSDRRGVVAVHGVGCADADRRQRGGHAPVGWRRSPGGSRARRCGACRRGARGGGQVRTAARRRPGARARDRRGGDGDPGRDWATSAGEPSSVTHPRAMSAVAGRRSSVV